MDWRWVLLTLVVAAVAAVRLRRRNPNGSSSMGSTAAQRAAGADRPAPAPIRPEPQPDDRPAAASDGASAAQDEGTLDFESVNAALERVWAEHAHDADTILDARLRQLIDRRVPVRGLRRAPGERAVRVAFADGTVLLCRGSGQGDFGRLGLALYRRSVRLAAFAHVEDLTRLEFAWSPDHRLAAVAVGLDQPD